MVGFPRFAAGHIIMFWIVIKVFCGDVYKDGDGELCDDYMKSDEEER